MNIKKISSKLLAAFTGAAVFVSAYAPTFASAAEGKTQYISELFLSYGDTDDKAKQRLTDNGYTVLDQNMNEQAEGGVSWLGLASTKRSVYLGYKTTANPDEAIRDMRDLNFNKHLFPIISKSLKVP